LPSGDEAWASQGLQPALNVRPGLPLERPSPLRVDGRVAFSCVDIRKAFGGVQALIGASLSASFGEVHALVGENGAGKSTLIKALGGGWADSLITQPQTGDHVASPSIAPTVLNPGAGSPAPATNP